MIIGIIGRKQSGKDTIGNYLVKEHQYAKYSFADPLKRGVMEMFGFSEEQMWGDSKEIVDPFWGVKPRTVLQVVGTELMQFDIQKYIPEFDKIGRAIWVKRFQQWYETHKDQNIVICDVRFQHEAEILKEMGGTVIKVVRPSLNSEDGHASEMEMDQIDYDNGFINDGTIDELYSLVDAFIKNTEKRVYKIDLSPIDEKDLDAYVSKIQSRFKEVRTIINKKGSN